MTAAVVGVILNLSLVFGAAVLLPSGLDPLALAIAVAAFLALWLRVEVVWVVLAGGLVGLARSLFL